MLWIAIMFAMIGAKLNMPTSYWLSFGAYITFGIIGTIVKTLKDKGYN